MALPPAVVEQSTGKVLSYISTKLDEKASRANTIARIEMAVSQIDFALEKTGKVAITYVSLLRRWKILKRVHMEGMDLLNKYNPHKEPDGQVVVRSSSYLHRFSKRAANLSISSIIGLVNDQLSPSIARKFEIYADWAEKFVTDVESCCPLGCGTFRYPFMRHLFEGKTPFLAVKEGTTTFGFFIWPVILEGRGVEAYLSYCYQDTDRLDTSFGLQLMLRISESTDIIGVAINCLRSSASLLKAIAQKALGMITLLPGFQDNFAYLPDDPPWSGSGIRQWYSGMTQIARPDPLCCQAANEHKPSVHGITSSEQTTFGFVEQIIGYCFHCFIPAPEYSMASVPEEAHRNTGADDRRPQHHVLLYAFAPHILPPCTCIPDKNCRSDMIANKTEECMYADLRGNASGTIDVLANYPVVSWLDKHGLCFIVEKPSPIIATVPQTSRRYKTRSAKKRKM